MSTHPNPHPKTDGWDRSFAVKLPVEQLAHSSIGQRAPRNLPDAPFRSGQYASQRGELHQPLPPRKRGRGS
jgi:hypothetical protein